MITPVTFSLDDATLSGGAAIVAAGGGLPRRITGAIDYEARVMALNPSGYWPMNGETGGTFVDHGSVGRNLTRTNALLTTVAVAGAAKGGDARQGVNCRGNSAYWYQDAAGAGMFDLAAGVPFTVLLWLKVNRNLTEGSGYAGLVTTKSSLTYNDITVVKGWVLGVQSLLSPVALVFGVSPVGNYTSIRTNGVTGAEALTGQWTMISITYSGGTLNTSASWVWYVNGQPRTVYVIGSATTTAGGTTLLAFPGGNTETYGFNVQDLAIWKDRALTAGEIAALSSAVPCGTARWTLPTSTADRTLKGVELPGSLARSISSTESRLGVRAYYQIDSGARVEFDPGDDLDVAIPAGSVPYIEADLTHHHLDDLPWIADANGGGPVALVDEPGAPQYLAAIAPVPKYGIITPKIVHRGG